MSAKTYRIVATREGDAWLADITDLAGAHTWSRSLRGLDKAVREVIGMHEDLPRSAEAALDLHYEYQTGDSALDEEATSLRGDRERAKQAEADVTSRTVALAKLLYSVMSLRDVAQLLGISPQRVQQIINVTSRQAAPE